MDFEKPDAYQALVNVAVSAGTRGEAWDLIGDRLNTGVDQVIPAYDAKLELNLNPKTPEKRQEVNELRWGKVKKDAVRLEGLAAAMENIVAVVKGGKDKLAHDWKGESFEAFKTAVDRVEKTLTDYAGACKTTAGGLTAAMDGAEQLYSQYADNSVSIFDFSAYPKAEDWKKVTQGDLDNYAETCGDWHEWTFNCDKDDSDAAEMIDKLATPEMLEWFDSNECDESGDKVRGMATDVVTKSNETKEQIREKIHGWYVATDDLKDQVTELQDAALDNLRIMAELKVFGLMKVPGAPTGDGNPGDQGGGDQGGGDQGGGDQGGGGNGGGGTGSGGGGSGSGGGGQPAMPPTPTPDLSSLEQPPADSSLTDPSATDPTAQDPQGTPGADGQPETVKIEEDGRTIEVTSPDSQGQVKVTVDDGSGQPKTYTMDFGEGGSPMPGTGTMPAPGFGPDGTPGVGPDGGPADAGAQPGAEGEVIEPGEDGKAVISDPPMTITAERPGGGDTVVVTVDDGSGGQPTSYTLDYSDPNQSATPTADQPGVSTQPATGQPMPVGFTEPSAGFAEPAIGFSEQSGGWTEPSATPVGGFTEQSATPAGGSAEPAAAGFGGQAPASGIAEQSGGWTEPSATPASGEQSGASQLTSASGDHSSWGALGGALDGPPPAAPDGAMSQAATGAAETALAGAFGGGSGGDGDGGGQQSGGSAGAGMGGMMGGAGAGGGQSGDSERQSGQWRTTGNLFDDDYTEAQARIADSLGEIR